MELLIYFFDTCGFNLFKNIEHKIVCDAEQNTLLKPTLFSTPPFAGVWRLSISIYYGLCKKGAFYKFYAVIIYIP